MTPTEQDKLREQIVAVMVNDEWFHCSEHGSVLCDEAVDEMTKALNKLMQLITADRKRVELEARIDELTKLRRMFERLAEYADAKEQVMSEYDDHIAELKAQQEKV